MTTDLDIFDAVRLDDMEEGGIAPLFVALYHPTIRVTGDPDQIDCSDETGRDHLIIKGWSHPIEVPSPGFPVFPTTLSC